MKIAVMILGLLGGLWGSLTAGGMAIVTYTGFALEATPRSTTVPGSGLVLR